MREQKGKTLYIYIKLAPVSFLFCDFFSLTKLYSWIKFFLARLSCSFYIWSFICFDKFLLLNEKRSSLIHLSGLRYCFRFSFLSFFPQQIVCSCGWFRFGSSVLHDRSSCLASVCSFPGREKGETCLIKSAGHRSICPIMTSRFSMYPLQIWSVCQIKQNLSSFILKRLGLSSILDV